MKRKNGFTLIELIVTIGLMVLIGVVIANNLTSVFSHREDENISDFQNMLQDAACLYIDLSDPEIKNLKATCKSNGCTVKTGKLIENGLLDENEVNPLTKQKINGLESITIRYINGEKICTYNVG